MATATETHATARRLSATDPNFAFLASRAAIELDRILQKKPIGTEAVTELGLILKDSTQIAPGRTNPAALWNPRTISIIHNAISAEGSNSVATLDQLVREALRIAEGLESTNDGAEDFDQVRRLRSFCIGLANSAIAYERSQVKSKIENAQWS